MKTPTPNRPIWAAPWMIAFYTLAIAAAGVVSLVYTLDFFGGANEGSFFQVFYDMSARAALSNLPEVIVGVLGIAITVVAIIVELAANRYTPRISELFVRAPVNFFVLGFFVVTAILCIVTSLLGTTPGFVPRIAAASTVVAVIVSMLILLPYFVFVFHFLEPRSVIKRMGAAVVGAMPGKSDLKKRPMIVAKKEAVRGIEQLSDVALNASENKDKGICMLAVATLGKIAVRYRDIKPQLPQQWFTLGDDLRGNPDFVSMEPVVLDDIEQGRYWFEMKIFRQFQMLYGETLGRLRDINYLIAIHTRQIASQALDDGDEQIARLAIKFFNTYLRATINAGDLRTAYNVFNQYRLLAEYALRSGRDDVAIDIAERFKYYGQLGFSMGLPFTLETSAYDLCTLNELAFEQKSAAGDALLSILLEVDKEGETEHDLESSLRGVRKAQVKLATYFLVCGAEDLARRVFDDMRSELPARLRSIRQELLGITSREFWEISDRGINFDYLEADRREKLAEYFKWFEDAEISLTSYPPLA